MAMGMATVTVLIFSTVAALLPGPSRGGEWTVGDRVMLVLFGLAMAAMLWRWASIRAVASADGLLVRNLMLTRRVRWDEIAHVRFPDGDPWVTLDLTDTDTLAVMAIQRADGEFGQQEAVRLATLVHQRQDSHER
jgi:hypothetical protein